MLCVPLNFNLFLFFGHIYFYPNVNRMKQNCDGLIKKGALNTLYAVMKRVHCMSVAAGCGHCNVDMGILYTHSHSCVCQLPAHIQGRRRICSCPACSDNAARSARCQVQNTHPSLTKESSLFSLPNKLNHSVLLIAVTEITFLPLKKLAANPALLTDPSDTNLSQSWLELLLMSSGLSQPQKRPSSGLLSELPSLTSTKSQAQLSCLSICSHRVEHYDN